MAFWGDYHTHTVYSHGKGCIEENVLRAAKIGLKEIAIADHGFNHIFFNVRRSELKEMRRQIEDLRVKYPVIRVYLSVESNLLDRQGHIDVKPSDREFLDITVSGFHKLVFAPPSSLAYFTTNFFGSHSSSAIARNTDAYVNAIAKNEIDILSHPGNFCKCDVREVARACKCYGTYFELNGKRIHLTDKELEIAAGEGVEFVCDSDAHTPRRVGDFSVAIAAIERVGIPYDRIANYDRLPVFRSRKGK